MGNILTSRGYYDVPPYMRLQVQSKRAPTKRVNFIWMLCNVDLFAKTCSLCNVLAARLHGDQVGICRVDTVSYHDHQITWAVIKHKCNN